MRIGVRWPVALATIVGLGVGIWTIGTVGIGDLSRAAAHLGIGGFVALCGASLVLMVVLGAAWLVAMPGGRADRLPLFAWARTAREASNDILPFSQIGGLVVGARTLLAARLPAVPVYAAMIVDLTTEMASQLLVTLFGIIVLASRLIDGELSRGLWVGVVVCTVTLLGFVTLQRPLLGLMGRAMRRMLPQADLPLEAIRAELDRIYARRDKVAASLALNLAGWVLSAVIGWATLAMMEANVPFGRMLALESLIFAVRSAAFMIPGALGVQEAAYLVLAQGFGIDPQAAVALSLVKRARDVAIGVPVLVAWQARELRAA